MDLAVQQTRVVGIAKVANSRPGHGLRSLHARKRDTRGSYCLFFSLVVERVACRHVAELRKYG